MDTRAQDLVPHPADPFPLIGETAAICRLREQLELAAGCDEPVLIVGEAGTGKEAVARATHARSRSGRSRWRSSTASVSGAMIPADLFGHVAGASNSASHLRTGRLRAVPQPCYVPDDAVVSHPPRGGDAARRRGRPALAEPQWTAADAWQLSFSPTLVIGVGEGDSGYLLNRATLVVRLRAHNSEEVMKVVVYRTHPRLLGPHSSRYPKGQRTWEKR